MTTKAIRSGINAGMVFAVVIIFMALIGFTVTGAALIAKILGHPAATNQLPALGYFVVFMALLGLWNGAYAAKPDPHHNTQTAALTSGLVAGLVCGVLTGALGLVFGSLLDSKIDPRVHLAMVSPDSMKYYLFQQSELAGAGIHLALATVFALLGSLLAFTFRSISLGSRVRAWFSSLTNNFNNNTLVNRVRRTPYAIYALYLVIAVLLFFLPRTWGSYWNYIIGTVGIYVILGLGLNIIVGLAGQLVLGYVAFFAIGAYSVALLTAPQPHNLHWNFWIALLVGIVLAALTGILLGLPILRLRGDYLAIVTLGFGEIIRILLRSDLLTSLTAGPKGVRNIGMPTLFGKPFSSDIDFVYLIFVAMLLVIFFTNRLQNSRTGRAWVAIREDEVAARATGINTFQSKLLALAIGAAFAGLGGVLFASRNQFTGPEDHVLMVSINVLALVIVGGMGSIPGIILGAFALKGLPEILRELDVYRLMFFGGLLVVMMILRPEGLWPATRPKLERQPESKPAPGQQVKSAGKTAEVEGVQHASNT